MDVGERQVPPDEPDVGIGQQRCPHRRLGLAAVGALEVAVFHHGDRRVSGAADVIAILVHHFFEVDELLGGAEQRRARRRAGIAAIARKAAHIRPAAITPAVSTPSFASAEVGAGEGERRDQERHREADAADQAAAEDRAPAHGRQDPAPRHLGHQPAGPDDGQWLADDVGRDDSERDRLRVGVLQEPAADDDAGVGQSEQRNDDVTRPRVLEPLQPGVRRLGRGEPDGGGPGQFRRRLLAEQPHQSGRLPPGSPGSGSRPSAIRPIARPATTGSTPLPSSAAQMMTPSSA